jgi:hypothetical protein
MPVLHIFDLDRTVIDSDHRTPYKAGTQELDLAAYRKMQTHSNIMRDQLLPLALYMRILIANGEAVGIVTARRMTRSDYYFLRSRNIKPAIICSRDRLYRITGLDYLSEAYYSSDSEYKGYWLDYIQATYPNHMIKVYDDHKGVLEVANSMGILAYDAVSINSLMADILGGELVDSLLSNSNIDTEIILESINIAEQVERFNADYDLRMLA